MATNESVAWIARIGNPHPDYPIGKIVDCITDEAKSAKKNKKQIAKWLREGMTVERVPMTWARRNLGTTHQYVGE